MFLTTFVCLKYVFLFTGFFMLICCFYQSTKLIYCFLRVKCIRLHHSKQQLLPFKQAVTIIIVQGSCPSLHCNVPHFLVIQPTACSGVTLQAERTPRSERKRRDSFGMYDGYESCSEESTSSSSSEDSDDEVVPSIPASLPIIKNNGQVYTYPDGKAGMGEWLNGNLQLLLLLLLSSFVVL